MTQSQINHEFDRQLQTLLEKAYPKLSGRVEEEFKKLLVPLKQQLPKSLPEIDLENGKLPFVIVIKSQLIPAEQMMEQVERSGKRGITKLFPHFSTDFSSLKVQLPESPVYLLINIDRGKETINITPEVAFQMIVKQGSSPLTIDEGIAIVTHFPDFLQKNNCFSLLASRNPKDQRVPAIWINAQKHPNLGWCWDRNPHTWLGSASAKIRIGTT